MLWTCFISNTLGVPDHFSYLGQVYYYSSVVWVISNFRMTTATNALKGGKEYVGSKWLSSSLFKIAHTEYLIQFFELEDKRRMNGIGKTLTSLNISLRSTENKFIRARKCLPKTQINSQPVLCHSFQEWCVHVGWDGGGHQSRLHCCYKSQVNSRGDQFHSYFNLGWALPASNCGLHAPQI